MSDERELVDINTGSSSALLETEKKSIVEYERGLTKEQIKAKLVSVVDRGFTNDRLYVPLPADLHGEWIHKDDVDFYKGQGFESGTSYAEARSLHGSGQVGDVVFMVCAKVRKEAIDELRTEKFQELHGISGRGNQGEERDYAKKVKTQLGTDLIPATAESTVTPVSGDMIRTALAGDKS